MQKLKQISLPYVLSVRGILIFYIALCVSLVLLLTRKSTFWHQLPPAMHTWGSHISNLAISWLLFMIVGMIWTLQGVKAKVLVWLGIFFVAVNFIIELFVPVLNTRDIIDALFGIAGVLLGGLCLCLLYRARRNTER